MGSDVSESAHPLDDEGVWCEVRRRLSPRRAALFLDRDGVVVEEADYLSRASDIVLIEGAAKVIAAANARGIPVVLVTNQAGIGRGYFGWDDFASVQNALQDMLSRQGATFDSVYACAHHPDAKASFAHPDHPARKPNPGMLLRAGKTLDLDLAKSWLVGDKVIDSMAAKNAGLAGAMHVLTGYGKGDRAAAEKLREPSFDVRVGRSIADALTLPLFQAG